MATSDVEAVEVGVFQPDPGSEGGREEL